ncbi:MAG: hypothetical protein D6785_15600, partial [Planctomycetota bacterium]
FNTNPHQIRILKKDPSYLDFERPLPHPIYYYEKWTAIKGKIFLSLNSSVPGQGESHVGVILPQGGFILPSFALYSYLTADRTQWILHPFRFFSQAFQTQNLPKPDLSLYFGNRGLFISIDGDGFLNPSEVDGQSFSADIIYRNFLYPSSFPHTISFIVGEISPKYLGSQKSLELARRIASLPHVEGASHGVAHPLNWKKRTLAYSHLPGYKFSLHSEIVEGIQYLNKKVFQPYGKKVSVFLWTGDCMPTASAFFYLQKIDCLNLNGGDSRMDPLYPSICHLSPLARQVGPWIQPYSCSSNEIPYTEEWHKNFHAFSQVLETWKNTDGKRLLKPIHLYYHFYAGEKIASIQALKKLYAYLESHSSSLTPIFTSRYSKMVMDFFRAKIYTTQIQGKRAYKLENMGRISTIRLPFTHLYPHLQLSKGVVGFCHYKKNLYIYLDRRSQHLLVLTSQKPQVGYVGKSNYCIDKIKRTKKGLILNVKGYGPGRVEFRGLKPLEGYRLNQQSIRADKDGRILYQRKKKGDFSTTLKLVRESHK